MDVKNKVFQFGENVKGFDIKVLNEREVRAGAGILFFFAMVTFMTAFLVGNFYPTKVFVVAFLIDFIIRIFINPKYAPSLILGRIIVRNQKPEYVGAPQKKFAWILGLLLAILMFVMIIINNIFSPINLLVCITCLVLLLSESAFGVCWGCIMYEKFIHKKPEYCPGGTCEVCIKEEIQKVSWIQAFILFIFLIFIFNISPILIPKDKVSTHKTTDGISTKNKACSIYSQLEN